MRACLVCVFALSTCGPPPTPEGWRRAWDAEAGGWIMNVWGPTATEVYAVGGSPDAGRLRRFDGSAATDVTLPEPVPLLNWVHGFGSDDIHVVGNRGTALHYDGNTWRVMETPTDQDLWGVWGAAPNDVWAVGGSAGAPDAAPVLLRFDGTSWTEHPVPPLTPAGVEALFKVWGSGADDVYAVGDVGVMIHWDGATWTEVDAGAGDDFVAIFGTGPDDIVAVGGRSNGLVAHWDGTEWHTEFIPALAGLNGVWMREPGVAHVCGLFGTVGIFRAETFSVEPVEIDEPLDFHAMYGVDGWLFAVGGNLAFPADTEGIAWRRSLLSGE